MKYHSFWLGAGLFLSLTAFNAKASLTQTAIKGDTFVYSSVSNVTWTGDANLLGTLQSTFGFNTVVDAIIAASPTITLPKPCDGTGPCGITEDHLLVTSDFNSGGSANRFGAVAFTNYLNSINFAGSKAWRLPDLGHFGELIKELGPNSLNTIPDTDNFTNETIYYMTTPSFAPFISWPYYPFRVHLNADAQLNVWAISPGKLTSPAAVPIPAALWLFVSGLMGLFGLTRRVIVK